MPQLLPERKKLPVPDNGDFSFSQIFASIGGGLAGAAVFAVLTKGTSASVLFAFLAPLPISIVALGFGLRHGATAGLIATGLLSIWPNPIFGLVYAFLVALPALAAAYVVSGANWRGRELVTSHAPAWAVLAAGGAVAAAVSAAVAIAAIRFGSLDEALNPLRARAFMAIEDLIRTQDLGDKLDASQLSALVVFAFPATLAALTLFSHALNLWGAGLLARASEALPRPWPDIAQEFVLPRAAAGAFLAACALAFLGDLPGEIGLVLAETLGLALAMQGLAVVHFLLRGTRIGGVTLTVIYIVIGLFAWPIVLFTVIGVADAAFSFRSRRQAAQARRG
ncbi:DUF2232 domain-containing protein [Methylosinus sp. LW4]|uniref:DUF2232 domain-containing protein n=1 Tax=Methylosinus sp. LW4 TaxID=136993 RepID=UPI0003669CB5|nr:DUF2232 domain-containing protein [Methylosinus sp. LW4]